MKKIFAFMFIVSCFFAMNFQNADARIDDSKLILGGINPGESRVKNIISIYGEPDEKELNNRTSYESYFFYGRTSEYGPPLGRYSVIIQFYDVGLEFDDNDGVKYITVKSNNGFSTPDGIKVGTTENELIQKYGSPDMIYKNYVYYYYGTLKFFRMEMKNGKVSKILAGAKEDYWMRKNNPKYAALCIATGDEGVPIY